jgi:Family of unknown function (DUF6585)
MTRTYKPGLALKILVALLMLVPGVVLLVVGAVNADARIPCLILGPILLGPGAVLWWGLSRMRLTVDDEGLTQQRAFGGEVRLRFDEVSEYRYQSVPVQGQEQITLSLHTTDGRQVKITSIWSDVFEMAQRLVEAVEPLLHAPSFGPVTLAGDAILYDGKRVPFAEIQSVTLQAARFRVGQKGKLLAAFAVGSLKVPNVFLLLDELRARGVSAADARPWRAVVSAAGFSLPKR